MNVVIVSAFGRADTLAVSLQKNGFSVSLFDCSEILAKLLANGSEAVSGPFPMISGVPAFAELESSLKSHDLPRGISVWLPEGPLELSGPMAGFQRERSVALQFLQDEHLHKQTGADFSKEWLTQFMYQMASPWVCESTKSYQLGAAYPFKEKLFSINNSTFAKGLEKSCSDAGVRRFQVKQWNDLTIVGQRLVALNFVTTDGTPGAQEVAARAEAPQFVWTLSSWESQHLNAKLSQQLFTGGVLAPDWQWVRLNLRSSVGSWISGIPYWSVVIEDIFLPWTHANSFILQKGAGGNWEVWLKVPCGRLAEPKAWNSWARGVESVLLERIPHGHWACDESSLKTYPQGLLFDVENRTWQPPHLNGFNYVGAEVLPRIDFACWFETLAKLLPKLEDSRNRENRKSKGARSDQALHAP